MFSSLHICLLDNVRVQISRGLALFRARGKGHSPFSHAAAVSTAAWRTKATAAELT